MNWTDQLPSLPTGDLRSLFGETDQATSATAKLDDGGTFRRQVDRRRMVRLNEITAAAEAIGKLPLRRETIHAVMSGKYDGFAIVHAVLKLAAPATIDHLHIATLGFNRRNTDELIAMLDAKQIGGVTFICSTYFQSVDTELFGYLHDQLAQRGQQCAVVRSHAKLLLFKMSNKRRYVWESSANLRSCRNVETFVLSEHPGLLDFHASWIAELITKTTKERRR